ncbi:recombination-associated protein RdgC [Comamonas denitrificans]|uniref:Recombination-associated protein RdgC n=1 Tax=Comamonas denitrificans TaxID=117506 RepID=A0A939H0E1_9BURK|nr:recombination-associated protein RdgC [Comamonas denitrificans]MBO1250732.1 recombination-associated protein RdgC [Comamonas denitrificans]
MIKNAIIYRISANFPSDLQTLEAALQKTTFQPCTPTQEKSTGWVPPRGEAHGALVESIGGQWMLRFHSEVKLLPTSVLQKRVQEKCDAIERESGRKPGKKEQRDLKEEARLDLLPQAFTKESRTWVWIDPQDRSLVVDTSSQAQADAVVTSLVECLPPGFALALLHTQTSPQVAMAQWLLEQEAPEGFSVDQDCELKSSGDSGDGVSVVRYGRHPLDIEEVRQHIEQGKLPTKLALTFEDRVSFVLTDGLRLRSIQLQDVARDDDGAESGFDADVAMVTGELARLLSALTVALGEEGGAA